MYARVATFENRDASRVEALVEVVRSRTASEEGMQNALRHLLLLDPCNRSALGVTLFATEEDVIAAEPVFQRLGAEIPETVRGRQTSVGVYEVAIDDLDGEVQSARVALLRGSPERYGDTLYHLRDQAQVEAAELAGWRGMLGLVDRAGLTKIITFWDSDDALRRSEIRETQLRIRVAASIDASIANVRSYDVAIDEALVAV